MVSTTEVIPGLLMQPFVRCYALREFESKDGPVIKPLTAQHELLLAFHLGDGCEVKGEYLSKGKVEVYDMISTGRAHILGPQSSVFGNGSFKGKVRLFTIQFTPAGFFSIFKISPQLFLENIQTFRDVLGKTSGSLLEQLEACKDVMAMAVLADRFLWHRLAAFRNNVHNKAMQAASGMLYERHGFVNISNIAYESNMSLKTFQRRFVEQVGLTPRLYARIVRFNKAVLIKMVHEKESWTSISHQLGYFDQNHFIKDFKSFAGINPLKLFSLTPPPHETFQVRRLS